MSDFISRFPVYLLLDTSSSMSGEPIEAVRQGLKALLDDLRNDPVVEDITYLSIITFDSSANQILPLTELASIVEPVLTAGGNTALDDAFRKLEHAFNTELRKKGTDTQKADYKPLVFLMTDGAPNDDSWKTYAKRLKDSRSWYDLIVCGAGPGVSDEFLHYNRRELTESVLKLDTLQPDLLKKFFKLVSQSIKVGSKSAQPSPPNGQVSILSQQQLPSGITAVP
jgi:uncharacterized protein YegL